ncbi:MAG: pilin [bacterium]
MNNKIKLIIFVIIVILLAWLGLLLFAQPTSAAESCENTQAIWNDFVKDSGVFFKCMPASSCVSGHTMIQPYKATCPKSTDRCCRPSDCTSLTPPDPKYPYKCVDDSTTAKQYMVCDKPYRCPGDLGNTCCHDLPTTPPQNAPMPALPAPIPPPTPPVAPAPTPLPKISLGTCCGQIVPDDTSSIDGLVQVAINIYNCIICLIGAIALLFVVLGGVVLLTSGGNSERVSLGRKMIVGAIIGTIIVLASVVIVNFAIKALGASITV